MASFLPPPPRASNKQTVLGKKNLTAQEGLAELKRAKLNGRSACWASLQPIIVPVDPKDSSKGEKCVLQCVECDAHLQPSNVSNINSTHFNAEGHCKKGAATAAATTATAAAATASAAGNKAGSSSGGLPGFTVSKTQQRQVIDNLVKFLVIKGSPSQVEDPHLITLLRTIGVTPPSRKELCQKLIPELYTAIKQEKMQLISRYNQDSDDPLMGQMATDGWKKKACAQGVPMVNAILNLPNGGSYFHKVVPVSGVCKDTAWITDLHNELADEITGGAPDKLLGVVMDNTKANCAAMARLQEQHPKWVVFGCQSHSLNLLIKDIANDKKVKWSAGVFSKALTIINVIGDSERIRALVNKKQLAEYGKTWAFAAHVPTRFGTLVFALRDLQRSKAALIATVSDVDEWGQASASSSKAQQMHGIISGHQTTFWADVQLLLTCCQPVMDAMHLLEGDKPLLSQLRDIYKQLRGHFQAFVSHSDTPARVRNNTLLEVVTTRLDKHYRPCFDAAFLLDPINFKVDAEGEWHPPFTQLSSDERKAAFQVIKDVAASTPEERAAVQAEWGSYRMQALSDDVSGDGLMERLTLRTPDPKTGRLQVASVAERRSWWATYMADDGYPLLAKAARRFLGMHTTSCAAERNWSVWGQVYTKGRNRLSLTLGEMIVFIRGNLSTGAGQDEEVVLRQLCEMEVPAEGTTAGGGAGSSRGHGSRRGASSSRGGRSEAGSSRGSTAAAAADDDDEDEEEGVVVMEIE